MEMGSDESTILPWNKGTLNGMDPLTRIVILRTTRNTFGTLRNIIFDGTSNAPGGELDLSVIGRLVVLKPKSKLETIFNGLVGPWNFLFGIQ